jgi:hypothetical protein
MLSMTCPYSKLRKPKKSWSFSAFRVLSRDTIPFAVAQPIKLLPHQGLLDLEALNHNSGRAGIFIEYGP